MALLWNWNTDTEGDCSPSDDFEDADVHDGASPPPPTSILPRTDCGDGGIISEETRLASSSPVFFSPNSSTRSSLNFTLDLAAPLTNRLMYGLKVSLRTHTINEWIENKKE